MVALKKCLDNSRCMITNKVGILDSKTFIITFHSLKKLKPNLQWLIKYSACAWLDKSLTEIDYEIIPFRHLF